MLENGTCLHRLHVEISHTRRPVGVGMLLWWVWWLTSSRVDQARHSCVNTESGQAEAWPSATTVFLHILTSGCLTSGSNRQPRDSIILHLSFWSHHSHLVLLLFDILMGQTTPSESHHTSRLNQEPRHMRTTSWRWRHCHLWHANKRTALFLLCDNKC